MLIPRARCTRDFEHVFIDDIQCTVPDLLLYSISVTESLASWWGCLFHFTVSSAHGVIIFDWRLLAMKFDSVCCYLF